MVTSSFFSFCNFCVACAEFIYSFRVNFTWDHGSCQLQMCSLLVLVNFYASYSVNYFLSFFNALCIYSVEDTKFHIFVGVILMFKIYIIFILIKRIKFVDNLTLKNTILQLLKILYYNKIIIYLDFH